MASHHTCLWYSSSISWIIAILFNWYTRYIYKAYANIYMVALRPIRPIALNWTPSWSYIHSAVEVHTPTHCRINIEHLGPACLYRYFFSWQLSFGFHRWCLWNRGITDKWRPSTYSSSCCYCLRSIIYSLNWILLLDVYT